MSAWSALGAFLLGLEAYVLTSWAVDGGYRLASTGAAGEGRPERVVDVVLPLASVAGTLLLGVFLFRRCRARGLDFDALLFVSLLLASWQSPFLNWVHPVLAANTNVLGAVSSWGPYMPGWQGEGAHREAELPLVTLSISLSVLLATVGCSAVMRLIADRRPAMNRLRLVLTGFLLAVLFDATEPLITFIGVTVWTRAVPGATLWSAHWYQFPLYQMSASGLFVGTLSALRLLRNADGETWVEHGVSAFPSAVRPVMRLLAVLGATNAALVLYTGVHVLVSLADGSPPDCLPAYFRPPASY
ncbi:spirocyclase AveC family protein [Streptomyces sp. AV19]|uniref:spirocyclase AveC family protein n=1 Tax=Streptomyces sp. AV19 TaxID=2793068 RepID=UPI0024137EC4|nr:spirocyclase AveC family protein [Streptomyces sp. AV19]MDG4533639.1 spirocyclase AveC family protein [Streptomyces sp. AV19]